MGAVILADSVARIDPNFGVQVVVLQQNRFRRIGRTAIADAFFRCREARFAACMLGAGYAAPLTGVVFVAEYTGQAGLIVPALVAMAMTRLVVGSRSVSPNQLE